MSENNDEFPQWANSDLSEKFTKLIPKGESQTIEFKKKYHSPESMSKEVAAFSTSNDGIILIGVDDEDNGHTVVGIENGFEHSVRDKLVQSLEGCCSGSVKPPITPSFDFLIINDLVVLAVNISKGIEPIYYNNKNIPYVRNFRQSRPADPSIVKKLFEKYFTGVIEPEKEISCKLVNFMRDILIILDQTEQRQVNPWSDQWKSEVGDIAKELREIAISDVAETYKFDGELIQLSITLDSLSNLVVSTRVGPEELIDQLRIEIETFKEKHLKNVQLSDENYKQILEIIFKTQKKLNALLGRTDQLINDLNEEELMGEASDIGRYLLTVCYYDIDSFLDGNQERLKSIGTKLNLIETERLHDNLEYCLVEIVKKLIEYNTELDQIVSQIKSIHT